MNVRAILEWAMLAVILLCLFVFLGYTRPGQAQEYGPGYGDDRGGVWMDPNDKRYQRYPPPQSRDRSYGGYGGRGRPEYWSDIGNPPQMTTYPNRGRYRRR